MSNRKLWTSLLSENPAEKRRAKNKFAAKKEFIDGYKFDSGAEAQRYRELVLMKKAKVITQLVVHPSFSIDIGPLHVCTVIADFKYMDCNIGLVAEDVKGHDTALSSLKRKLVEACHGIKIVVVKS